LDIDVETAMRIALTGGNASGLKAGQKTKSAIYRYQNK
jgi:hypothetical protein